MVVKMTSEVVENQTEKLWASENPFGLLRETTFKKSFLQNDISYTSTSYFPIRHYKQNLD